MWETLFCQNFPVRPKCIHFHFQAAFCMIRCCIMECKHIQPFHIQLVVRLFSLCHSFGFLLALRKELFGLCFLVCFGGGGYERWLKTFVTRHHDHRCSEMNFFHREGTTGISYI